MHFAVLLPAFVLWDAVRSDMAGIKVWGSGLRELPGMGAVYAIGIIYRKNVCIFIYFCYDKCNVFVINYSRFLAGEHFTSFNKESG